VSAPDPARVLLADHDRGTREGIRLSLAGHDLNLCAEADSADAAVAAAREARPDVCLIEVDLPGGGIAAVEGILQEHPTAAIVMLSASNEEDYVLASLRAGAKGYLRKDMDPARLPAVLRGVLKGEAALPRGLMGRVISELRALQRGRHTSELAQLGVELSRRERQVLELLERGLETPAIAAELGIAPVTVRRHVSGMVQKLGAPDRATAVRMVREARG
jgi:two-component system, NarL family, nitrate/nitrite response regulator NarL